jgi:hypothetical protein
VGLRLTVSDQTLGAVVGVGLVGGFGFGVCLQKLTAAVEHGIQIDVDHLEPFFL